MRVLVAGLVSAGLMVGMAAPSIAAQSKRHPSYSKYRDNSPAAVAARQRNARTFDGTQYYEHNLNKIPLGTQAWWDQWGRENGGTRP
jgi:hypothetical protein